MMVHVVRSLGHHLVLLVPCRRAGMRRSPRATQRHQTRHRRVGRHVTGHRRWWGHGWRVTMSVVVGCVNMAMAVVTVSDR